MAVHTTSAQTDCSVSQDVTIKVAQHNSCEGHQRNSKPLFEYIHMRYGDARLHGQVEPAWPGDSVLVHTVCDSRVCLCMRPSVL